ncbi:MAG: isoaspartyl peptidase/L-asparaginase [Chitinophagaceae bacterium]|nr:isoaspartyl peptidase/L-asparaginase [Chitinophagaceae bacterium]
MPIALVIHGGAGPDSSFIRENIPEIEDGLKHALYIGYQLLEKGDSALNVVEAVVNVLEDNPYFNAGKGSALNNYGQVEMDASIMEGQTMRSGAVAGTKTVKNPVSLARAVMEKTPHILLAGDQLDIIARKLGFEMKKQSYFITQHQRDVYLKSAAQILGDGVFRPGSHGTVGAVALDYSGNLAAATSTGGTEGKMPGRISDSCIIGSGCYANNKTCAVSSTGDGELLMKYVTAHAISDFTELLQLSPADACNKLIHERIGTGKGDAGVISVNTAGQIGIAFNSERMPRGWKTSEDEGGIAVY